MKKVIVTGANGFIGHNTIEELINSNYEVHAIASKSYISKYGEKWHQHDLLNIEDTKKLIQDLSPSHFLHLAWVTDHNEYWHSEKNIEWLYSSIELAKCFYESGGQRLVTAGTCAEYDWEYKVLNEQNTPLNAKSLYSACKSSLYNVIHNYAEKNNFSYSHGRVFFAYGPQENQAKLIPHIIKNLLNNKPVVINNGSLVRDFIHSKDCAGVFGKLLESDCNGAVNIGSGQGVSLRDITYKIANILNKNELIKINQTGENNSNNEFIADVSLLKKQLNFDYKYDIESGIKNYIDWMVNNA